MVASRYEMKKGILFIVTLLMLVPVLCCEDSSITITDDTLIFLNAEPSSIVASRIPPDPSYGETVLTARILNSSNVPIQGIGVIFSATPLGENGGLLSGGSPVRTNSDGRVSDVLKNDRATTVKAATGSVTAEIRIPFILDNIRPSAMAVAEPNPALVEQWIAFDGTRSRDNDGSITNYKWEFWYDQYCDPDPMVEPARPPETPNETSEGSGLYVVVRRFDHEQQVIAVLTVTDNLSATDSYGICENVVTSIP